MKWQGKVYLVGAGPGAPDLLTLRAARLLEQADVVLHDALVHPQTLALAARARRIDVGKRCGGPSTEQAFILRRLVEEARRHACVVRLKGGDPMLFGRAQEEIDALRAAGIPFEVVPGITSALAAAAQTGVSLTRRATSRSVSFATPRTGDGTEPTDWTAAARSSDTTVLYMATRRAEATTQALIAAGHPPATPVLVCADVSLPGSVTHGGHLHELPALCATIGDAPAIVMLGEVFREAAMRHATAAATSRRA